MEGVDFLNELDYNTFFAGIDDLVDCPADTVSDFYSGASSDLSDLWSDPLPYEDMKQLEWLSDFVENADSDGGLTMPKETIKESSSSEESQASSPMSSGSFSSEERTFSPQRGIRTKRPRPTTFTAPSFPVPSSQNRTVMIPVIEGKRLPKPRLVSPEDKKKKKMKPTIPMAPAAVEANGDQTENVRKCLHCEITKTPQWRAGPMGPKTLCNACGVRYKSGRLFPEYRPAASPTFVASLHSNSHRKVVEMRNRSDEKSPMEMIAQLELIPNTTVPSFD